MTPIGRSLPHSIESEDHLLSCCLLDGAEVIARCEEANIRPESFYDPKHGIIFDILLGLTRAGKPTEVDVVAEELQTQKKLDSVGGYAFLTQISSRIPTTAQAGYFIEKVRELSLLREMIRSATGAVEDCYNFSGGIEEFIDQIETKIFNVTQQRVSASATHIRELTKGTMASIAKMRGRSGELSGIGSGFVDLDRLTWGFQKAEMIVLAARPSMGKTALALNFAENAALPRRGKGVAVLVFSLEMSAEQLSLRLLCSRARVNMFRLRDGLTNASEETLRLSEAANELSGAMILIDDSSSISVMQMRAKARRIHARTPLGMIVVDYLQLLASSDSTIPREQQVSEVSRGLKALAKDLNLPVIVLSQLNRMSETQNRAPRLADLRESGSIEQDSDVVMLLSRPKDGDDKYQVAGATADLVVAKQRNGPVGELKLTFLRDITRFESFTQ